VDAQSQLTSIKKNDADTKKYTGTKKKGGLFLTQNAAWVLQWEVGLSPIKEACTKKKMTIRHVGKKRSLDHNEKKQTENTKRNLRPQLKRRKDVDKKVTEKAAAPKRKKVHNHQKKGRKHCIEGF